jgi:hypothetical protein
MFSPAFAPGAGASGALLVFKFTGEAYVVGSWAVTG